MLLDNLNCQMVITAAANGVRHRYCRGIFERTKERIMYKLIRTLIFWINTVLFSAASIICFAAVIFRYVFNNSIVWAEESVRFMFVFLFFFGAAEAVRRKKHVMMDVFINMLPGKAGMAVRIFDDLLVLAFLCAAAWLGYSNAMKNMGQLSAALHIPYGLMYLSIPIGCILMAILTIYNIIDEVRAFRGLPAIERG